MLELKDIKKDYPGGGETVQALKGISLQFRKSEFVSILGPSGCGKTTMLNIIGGLDQYTEGDLIINGKSTKDFKDRDWDAYRNHSVGFVFQSYNLIIRLFCKTLNWRLLFRAWENQRGAAARKRLWSRLAWVRSLGRSQAKCLEGKCSGWL